MEKTVTDERNGPVPKNPLKKEEKKGKPKKAEAQTKAYRTLPKKKKGHTRIVGRVALQKPREGMRDLNRSLIDHERERYDGT